MRRWKLGCALMAIGVGCGDDGGGVMIDAGAGPGFDAGATPDGGAWRELAPLAGGARQETAVVELGGQIYVIGGFNAQIGVVATVERYDPAGDSWQAVADLPAALHHVNAAAVGGKLYALGGLDGLSFTAVGDVYVYDPVMDAWSDGTDMPAGQARGASAVAAIGTDIYVAGGSRGSTVADFSRYDTVGGGWTDLPDLPTPRNHLVGAAAGGVFYAIGGRATGITDLHDTVEAFSPMTGAWTTRTPMPTPRGGMAAGVVNGIIYVVGGEGSPDDPMGVFPDNEAYDPATDAWTVREPMRTPRHGTGAAGLDGVLYVPGGATQMAFGAVATVEAFTP